MSLNEEGLTELKRDMGILSDMAQIVKIRCEIKGFPRLRRDPVLIIVEAVRPLDNYEMELSVPRQLVTSPVFISEKTQVAYVYAILLDTSNPCSEVVIKIASSSDGKEGYYQSFLPKKDKVTFFDFEKELLLGHKDPLGRN